jgi:DNA-binding transcriptional LysR family regulator
VDFKPFRDNEIVAIAHPGHPLVTAEQVSLLALSQQTLLTRESGSGTRLILEDLAREEAVILDDVQCYGSLEAIKTAVKSQSGVALLPLDCCREDINNQNLALLPIQNFPHKRSWCTMKLRHRQLTPVTHSFLQYLLTADR